MKKSFLFLILSLIYVFGCKKTDIVPTPQAEFTFQNSTQSGLIYFKNVSTNSNDYSWDFGDGRTSTETHPSHTYSKNGTYQVTLVAVGEQQNGVVVKNVSVSNVTGSLLIYKAYSTRSDRNINVYVDGKYAGSINGTYYYTSAPSCGNVYSVTASNLSEGSHTIQASETGTGAYSWSSTVKVTGGICNSLYLSI